MSLPVKLGVGTLALGSIGGIAYAGISYSQQGTEISKLIDEEYKYILLDTKDENQDDKQWGANWDSYKKANESNDKDFFELEGWNRLTKPDLKHKLRKKCEELSKSKIQSREEKLYEQVTNYCGRHVSIKDQGEKEKLRLIDTNNGGDAWTKLVAKENEIKTDLTNLGITAKSPAKITAEEIKEGCKKAVEKNKSQDDYDKAYASYKVVCAS